MREDTITALPDPNGFSADPLTDLIRSGARQLIEQAFVAELSALPAQFVMKRRRRGMRVLFDMATCLSARSRRG